MARIDVFVATNKPTGSIQRNANDALDPTVDIFYVILDDAEFAVAEALVQQINASGRSWMEYMEWDGSAFVELPDDRVSIRVTSDIAEIELPGSAALTFQVLKPDGTDNTTFDGVRIYEIFGRLMKLTFVNGVALKTFTPSDTGRVEFNSDEAVKIEAPLRITVVEV